MKTKPAEAEVRETGGMSRREALGMLGVLGIASVFGDVVRRDAVAEELQHQIAEGLMAGGVCGMKGLGLTAAGLQRRNPQPVPMAADAIFDTASVSKTFTASLAALLAAEGRLDPDAPFTDYLPQHALAKRGTDVTVRDLATHMGGFDNSKPYIVRDRAEFDRRLMAKLPVRPRMAKCEYACSNFIYLGKIVENLTGTDLESAARKMLWSPLGMRDTTWSEICGNQRAVETFTNGRLPPGAKGDESARAYGRAMGNGAAFSTAGDLLRFTGDLLERRTFPRAYYDLLFAERRADDGTRRSFGWDMNAASTPEGWSASTISHGGYTGNTIAVDPVNGFAGVVLTNRTGERLRAYAGHRRLLSVMGAELRDVLACSSV